MNLWNTQFTAYFIFKLISVASVNAQIGFLVATDGTGGSLGVRWDTSTDTGKFKLVASDGIVDSLVTADTNWHVLKVRGLGNNYFYLSLDGETEQFRPFNSSTDGKAVPGFSCVTNTTAAKTLSADMFSFYGYGLNRSGGGGGYSGGEGGSI
jgi:hypothetical protein